LFLSRRPVTFAREDLGAPRASRVGMGTDLKVRTDAKIIAARSFVRSLNILLKFVRLYGFEHVRTAAQFETTWNELRAAVPPYDEAGLLLGATGSQLLVDGVPLETGAERSFAQMLSAAGLSSIHFSSRVTQAELTRFVRGFPAGRATPAALVNQLRAALAGVSGIRINEIRFIAEDGNVADAKLSAQIITRTMGADAEQFREWLNDPQKLLQLIAAAEGTKGGSGSGAGGTASTEADPQSAGAPDADPGSRGGSSFAPQDEDILGIMRVLTRLGQLSAQADAPPEPRLFQQQLSTLPERAQDTLRRALASLAAQTPAEQPGEPVLLKLAEHMAIRFALDRFERGEVRVNAVRQMLDRMSQEIENLRKVLGAHEEKMSRAGLLLESHTDILDRQFWATVPEAGKRSVLLSPEAWCIPPRNVQQYVEELLQRGEIRVAHDILQNYASCIANEDPEARRKTATGLTEFAELYASGDTHLLLEAIRHVGVQLTVERKAELQSVISAAFVRLGQEAAKRRCYPAIQQVLASLDGIENQRPAFAQSLRPRIGVETRVPEFIEEALHTEQLPTGLPELLRLTPRPAADHLVTRFNRCSSREDCDRLVALARELGPEGLSHLRETFRAGSDAEAVETVGLLSRLDASAAEQFLPERLRLWQRSWQDRVVRQLAAAGAPERSRLLLAVFDRLDPLIMPLALDEIGMLGDASAVDQLVALAEGNLPDAGGPYLRLKAIEALGRLRATQAASALRQIVEAKHVWRWAHASELRIVAAQALQKMNPDWAREFLPRSGLTAEDLSMAALDPSVDSHWTRQRRYPRLRLARPLAAVTTNLRESCRLEIKVMNLGGGAATCDRHLPPGTVIALKINPGLRPTRAQAIVRSARTQAVTFELADIDLEERAKLRRLLLELAGSTGQDSADATSRHRAEVPATSS